METLAGTLLERVETLIEARKEQSLLSTTTTSAAIAELALRSEGLEDAIREIALEVQKLSAAHDG
jgi:hypothetical protein